MSKFDLLDPISRGPWSGHTAQAIEDNFSKIFSNSGRFGQDASSLISAIPITTGSGNPQGVVAASLGNLWLDTATGYQYLKVGGGDTKYGWVLDRTFGGAGLGGPQQMLGLYSGTTAAAGALRFTGYGYFMQGAADTTEAWVPTGVTTLAHTYVSGKLFKSVTSSGAAPNISMYHMVNAQPRQVLDDDIDMFVEFRTGSDITTVRYWFGITASVITDSDTFGVGSNGALLFRYSTVIPDSGWIGQSCINGAANHSETSAIATIAADTTYLLRLRFVRTTGTPAVYFSVNHGAEQVLTTNIPPTGSTYFPIFGLTTKAASARTYLVRSYSGWQGS